MKIINTNLIEEAVYNLCVQANTQYDGNLYNTIYEYYSQTQDNIKKQKLQNILKNIKIANDTKRPLCQDTGQVLVFVEIGQEIYIEGSLINDAVNNAVKNAYKDNYYRLSVVENALFNRENTNTNTPAIIYTNITEGSKINIKLLIKGAGSENYSAVKMFKPSSEKEEIFEFIKQSIISAGEKSCPPLVLGLGIGGTMDSAAVMSKKAFFKTEQTIEEKEFLNDLYKYLDTLKDEILDIKLMTSATHIASLPAALTINCHSTRHAECTIDETEITYCTNKTDYLEIPDTIKSAIEINTNDTVRIKSLKKGDHILLTGEIYTARDAAHKRIADYFNEHNKLPFDLNGKIIFYAGPCPAKPGEAIGPVGPTTSFRMDKFSEFMYSKGVIATIGKGERSKDTEETILKYGGKYFTAQGGIACLLAECVKKSELVCFEELGTEAVRKLYVEKFPLRVEI